MERCYLLSKELLKFLAEQEIRELKRDFFVMWKRIHNIGSARIAAILSVRRGVDFELGYAAGALHDFGRIVTGKQENHGANGYGPVREFLDRGDPRDRPFRIRKDTGLKTFHTG